MSICVHIWMYFSFYVFRWKYVWVFNCICIGIRYRCFYSVLWYFLSWKYKNYQYKHIYTSFFTATSINMCNILYMNSHFCFVFEKHPNGFVLWFSDFGQDRPWCLDNDYAYLAPRLLRVNFKSYLQLGTRPDAVWSGSDLFAI